MAERIQLSRRRGARIPDGAVLVSRPGRFGNPFRTGIERRTPPEEAARLRMVAAGKFDLFLTLRRHKPAWWVGSDIVYPSDVDIAALAGRSLACWCPLPEPGGPDWCHAAVLMRAATMLAEGSARETVAAGCRG
jgi:hypothetical protein